MRQRALIPLAIAPLSKPIDFRAVQIQAARNHDVAALVESVAGTIGGIVHYYGRGFSDEDKEDLRAAGRHGAVVAAGKYDPDHAGGASFNTYATDWVKAYVVREVFFFWGRGRLRRGRVASKMFFQHARERRALEAAGVEVTPEILAEVLGVPVDALRDVTAVVSAPDQLYDEVGDEDSAPTAAATDGPSVLDVLCGNVVRADVRAAVEALPERERFVMREIYFAGQMLQPIAEALGVTRQRVQQIEAKALAKLRGKLSRS